MVTKKDFKVFADIFRGIRSRKLVKGNKNVVILLELFVSKLEDNYESFDKLKFIEYIQR